MSLDTATVPPIEGPAEPLSVEEALHRIREIVALPTGPGKMTYEEFLAWADEDTYAEWVDGEVLLMPSATDRHQDIAGFLESVLRTFTEAKGLGAVRSAPFQMKLARGREPDVLFVSTANLSRLKPTHLDGPADLAVEITSPDSFARDRGEKFQEYAAGGVPEYWLIDPDARWAEFYHLESGHYRPAFIGDRGRYESQVVPGFWIRVEWLWQDPLPHVLETLHQLGLI